MEEDIAMRPHVCTCSARNKRGLAHLFRFAATSLAFVTLLSSAALAQPAVTVSPKSGPPADKVAVSGTGFAADEAVDIYFDTTALALAATGPGGAFTGIHLTVPASSVPGGHWITGVGRHSGLAAQVSFIVQTNWPQFRGGRQHDGYNSTENVLNVSNVAGLQLLWSAAIDAGQSSPAVASGLVYVGSDDSKLYAFNAATGHLVWTAATGGIVGSSPAVANGVVYVGSFDYKVYAFDAATGRQIWSALTGLDVFSSPTVANGAVYVGSADGNFYAFNAATGQQIWSASPDAGTDYQINSSPALAKGLVYVAADKLYAFNAATGQEVWSAAAGGASSGSSPAVENGVVYLGSQDNNLYALSAATGLQIWSAPTGGAIFSSPAVADGVVYVGSGDNSLYAFDAATGRQLWKAATGSFVESSPAVANGVVYVGSDDHNLYAFEAATGRPLWSVPTGNAVYPSPAVANGIVYVTSYDGYLYAFGLPPVRPPAKPNLLGGQAIVGRPILAAAAFIGGSGRLKAVLRGESQ